MAPPCCSVGPWGSLVAMKKGPILFPSASRVRHIQIACFGAAFWADVVKTLVPGGGSTSWHDQSARPVESGKQSNHTRVGASRESHGPFVCNVHGPRIGSPL